MHDSFGASHTANGLYAVQKRYRSLDGVHFFRFRFVPCGSRIDVFCLEHPSLMGQDESVSKTHLYGSAQLCFVKGREPRTQSRAEELAKQWAEYFLEYRRTGIAQE